MDESNAHARYGDDIRHDVAGTRFELEVEGYLSTVDYQIVGDRMVITHTFVPPELRGKGLAERLVIAALDHARAAGLRIVPQCSYVDAFLRRHPEFADLRDG